MGGDVVRLLFKLPNSDLTETQRVNEAEREHSTPAVYLFIGIPAMLQNMQNSLGIRKLQFVC